MQISYKNLCPECLRSQVTNTLSMDTEKTPLVYACVDGHAFEELPSEEAAASVVQVSDYAQAVPVAEEVPAAEMAAPGLGASAEPPAVPDRIRAMIEPPPAAGKDATPAPVPCAAAAADVVGKIRDAMAKKSRVCPEDVLAEVLRLGVVDIGAGEKLVVLRLPERVAVDVAAQAGQTDFREYFNALMVCAFDFGWFQNLNVQV